jgi:peptide/nickel transport system permease protein
MSSFNPPKTIYVGFFLLAVILCLALAAPWLSPDDPWRYTGAPLEAPSLRHPLGTNDVGQDLLGELLYGARTSLGIGLAAGLLASLISLGVGLSCAVRGGWYDFTLMRLVDAWLTVPPLLLVLLISAFLKPNAFTLVVVLSLFSWAGWARLLRAQGAEIKEEPYVQAAQVLGASSLYLARRHLLPAVYPLLALMFLTQVRRAILLESSLAFLGLADPTHKSWGVMIQYGFKFVALGDNWLWWLLPPSLALALTLISLALIVFALESWFEPTLRA